MGDNKLTLGGNNKQDYEQNLSLQNLYFSDRATDGHGDEILFKINIVNMSDFKVKVKSPKPTLKNASNQDITSVTCITSHTGFTLEAKGKTNSSKEITIMYKLNDMVNTEDIIDGVFNISLNFEMWQEFYTATITELFTDNNGSTWSPVTTTKLCTTMGHSIVGTGNRADGETEIPIQWYAFAINGVDTGNGYVYNNIWYTNNAGVGAIDQRWYSLNGINFNTKLEMILKSGNISAKGQTFWFIQQYTTTGGYYIGDADSTKKKGAAFDYTNNKYFGSWIYNYLNGEYLSAANIMNEDLFNSIQKRDVQESYTVNYSTKLDYVSNSEYMSEFSSKLWLISPAELGLITNKQTINTTSGLNYGIKTPGIGNQDLSKSYKGLASFWWLRAPGPSDHLVARGISDEGYFGLYGVDTTCGVRAAFQISIPD